MRFEDLSHEDQALVNTNFGDLEKEASARVQVAQEMYSMGFDKLASATADEMDKAAAEAAKAECKEDEKEEHDEEKKAASEECGKIIEKGFFDGLKKLGSERHGNEWHYVLPFVEEKVAAAGMQAALARFHEKVAFDMKTLKDTVKGVTKNLKSGYNAATSQAGKGYNAVKSQAGKGVEAVKEYHGGMKSDFAQAISGKAGRKSLTGAQRAAAAGRGAAKASPYALLASGGAYAATRDKKED